MSREPKDCDPEQRRRLVRALAAGVFAGGALLGRSAAAQETFSRLPRKLPEGQSVYSISGDVRVNGAVAGLRTRIAAGDTVETGAGGEVAFAVGDSAFLMRGGGRAELQGEPRDSLLLRGLRLVTGALLGVFGGGSRRLTTPSATIGIRGTGVYLEADPERTYFCTCYGIADVAPIRDPGNRTTVASRHHDRPLYILSGAPGEDLVRDGPFVNHTDQELMLVEALVGRAVPFVFPKEQYRTPRRRY